MGNVGGRPDLVRGPDGELRPRPTRSVTSCIGLMVGSVLVMAFLSASSLPVLVTYVGMIPFGLGTYWLMISCSKAESFERCKTAYETHRGSLLRKLDEIKRRESEF